MKLTIEHLGGYLPYGLQMYWEEMGTNKPKKPWILTSESIPNVLTNQNKPYLRPLSDLILDTDTCNLLEIINGGFLGVLIPEWYNVKERIERKTIRYSDMQVLLSNHYDVFGLIENNLAIDINTIS